MFRKLAHVGFHFAVNGNLLYEHGAICRLALLDERFNPFDFALAAARAGLAADDDPVEFICRLALACAIAIESRVVSG